MTQASYQPSQYVITAKAQKGVIQQTRMKSASAVVLAKTWIAAGYSEVQIVDPLGKSLSPNGYRGNIMGDGRRYR